MSITSEVILILPEILTRTSRYLNITAQVQNWCMDAKNEENNMNIKDCDVAAIDI